MFSLLLALLNNAYFISYIKSKTFDLPLNAKEERFYLEKKEQGDKNARDLLIEKNLRLVAHIAKKYNNNKDLQEDLILLIKKQNLLLMHQNVLKMKYLCI